MIVLEWGHAGRVSLEPWGRIDTQPLWWWDQYRPASLQRQHVLVTSSNNWITALYYCSFLSIFLIFHENVMESTSRWQGSIPGVGICSFTPGPDGTISKTFWIDWPRGKCYVVKKIYSWYRPNCQCPSLLTVRVRRTCEAKFSSDGGDSGSKKCKRGYGGAYGTVWRSML
jgi:hypothetical protein